MTSESKITSLRATLQDLTLDLRWSWRPEIRAIDPDRGLPGSADPWTILGIAPKHRLEELTADPAFRRMLERLTRKRRAYLADGGWYGRTHGKDNKPLGAYFSADAAALAPVWSCPSGWGPLTPADVVVQLYRDPAADEEPGAAILEMRAGDPKVRGWTAYGVPVADLSAPLDAYTARALPRDAVEGGPLALPLIAWQR